MTKGSTDAANPSAEQMERLAGAAFDAFGLSIEPKKYGVVTSRLTTLYQRSGCANLDEVTTLLREKRDRDRMLAVFDVLSTNHTHFFRESTHLDIFRSELLSEGSGGGRGASGLRVWSAGCSNGCEPFSIAITIAEASKENTPKGVRILATDLALSELRWAKQAQYERRHLDGVDKSIVQRYFEQVETRQGPRWSVRADLRKPIRFALLNLLEPWPMKGPFDAIFCRNVLIYFDQLTRDRIIKRFMDLLRPGGLMFLGTSEGISGRFPEFDSIGPSAYRKTP